VTLAALLRASVPFATVRGEIDTEVTSVCDRVEAVTPGALFVAREGMDNRTTITQALERGAVVIISEVAVSVPLKFRTTVPFVIVMDADETYQLMSAVIAG
jgi:UDP-N-acetylmuramyl tripeptide synthase